MPVLAALTVVSAVGSIYSGFAANSAANQEAKLQQEQADTALQEAQINAQNEAYNQTQTVQKQRLAFLANGVSLEGSPALVLEQSKEYGQSQVDAILRQGQAKSNLLTAESTITMNKGRTALIGGFTSAAGGLAQTYSYAKQSGALD